jgi:hypothetical protein
LDPVGNIDWEKLDLLIYLTGGYYSLGKKLGEHGYTNKK